MRSYINFDHPVQSTDSLPQSGVTKTTAINVQHQPARKPSHRKDPSIDLQKFTCSDAAGREPFSEDIANRNLIARGLNRRGTLNSHSQTSRSLTSTSDGPRSNPVWWPEDSAYQTYATYDPHQLRRKLVTKAQDLQRRPNSGAPDDRKKPRDADARPRYLCCDQSDAFNDAPTQKRSRYSDAASRSDDLDMVHANIIALPLRLRSLSRKRRMPDLRLARRLGHKRSQSFPGAYPPQSPKFRRAITRADLDKPLPPLPYFEDTTVHTEWAPAVTHHRIRRDVHELRQEHVTHDYHQDEYEHRVLPIIDTEILPARHFIQLDGGGLEEIREEDIPCGLPFELEQRISKAAATIFPVFRDSGYASLDGSIDPVRPSHGDSITSEEHGRRDTTRTYPPTFLPSQRGTESFHQLLFHLDGAGDRVERTHVRSFSDGPPVVPPRGVRQVDGVSVASL